MIPGPTLTAYGALLFFSARRDMGLEEAVVRSRTAKVLAAYDEESEDEALAALRAAEVDRRLRYPDPFRHVRPSAFLEGFSLSLRWLLQRR
jgi:hypothetical protein